MSRLEVSGLVVGTLGLVPLFREGRRIVQVHRQRKLLAWADRGSNGLANELDESGHEVSEVYEGFRRSCGPAFQRGDGSCSRTTFYSWGLIRQATARDQLKDVIILLLRELISVLHTSMLRGTLNGVSQLTATTVSGRHDAIRSLTELAQRLGIAQARITSSPFVPPASAAVQPFRWSSVLRSIFTSLSDTNAEAVSVSSSDEELVERLRCRTCAKDCTMKCTDRNCDTSSILTVCQKCGECSKCYAYYGRRIDKSSELIQRFYCVTCAKDCTMKCTDYNCDSPSILTVCQKCGVCGECDAYYGRDL